MKKYREYIFKNGEYRYIPSGSSPTQVKIVDVLPEVGEENTIYVLDKPENWIDNIRIKDVRLVEIQEGQISDRKDPNYNKKLKVKLVITSDIISPETVKMINETDLIRLRFNCLNKSGHGGVCGANQSKSRRRAKVRFALKDNWILGNHKDDSGERVFEFMTQEEIETYCHFKFPQVLPEHIKYNKYGLPYIQMEYDLKDLTEEKIKAMSSEINMTFDPLYRDKKYIQTLEQPESIFTHETVSPAPMSWVSYNSYKSTKDSSSNNADILGPISDNISHYNVVWQEDVSKRIIWHFKDYNFKWTSNNNMFSWPESAINRKYIFNFRPCVWLSNSNGFEFTSVADWNSGYQKACAHDPGNISPWVGNEADGSDDGFFHPMNISVCHLEEKYNEDSDISDWQFLYGYRNTGRARHIIRENTLFSFGVLNENYKDQNCRHIWRKQFDKHNYLLVAEYREHLFPITSQNVYLNVFYHLKPLPKNSATWKK